jgi:NitT/TauT family transport system permease protein
MRNAPVRIGRLLALTLRPDKKCRKHERQLEEITMGAESSTPRPSRRPFGRLGATARRIAHFLGPWALILVLWYGVRYSGFFEASLIPTPVQVATRLWDMLIGGDLALDMYMSTQRVFLGVMLGTACAVPVGFLLGWYKGLRSFMDPLINFFRALPPIALIPLVIVYFGIGESAKVIILFYAAFFASVIVMYEGISQISPLYIRVAQTLGASDFEIFRKVIIPLAVPHALTALRVALGVAWATLVAAELVAAQQGLGAVIQDASAYFQLDTIYMGIICIGFIALAMDVALRRLTRRALVWQERND